MSIINRITTWTIGQVLKAADLNGEFSNITNLLNNLDAATTSWTNVKATTVTPTTVGPFTASGAIAMGSNKITGIASATATTDAPAYSQIKIIQIVSANATSNFTTTSATFQTTNLSASITPASASNKVLVYAVGQFGSVTQNVQVFASIYRGATDLQTTGGEGASLLSVTGGQTLITTPLLYMDAPSATTSTTYAIKLQSDGTHTASFGGNQTMVLMEIQP